MTDLPSYEVVLELDRNLRSIEAGAPPYLRFDHVDTTSNLKHIIGPQRHMVSLLLHKALLALHRPYFAKAVALDEPMVSQFASSFNACVMSARQHTILMRSILKQNPIAAHRWWFFLCVSLLATDLRGLI